MKSEIRQVQVGTDIGQLIGDSAADLVAFHGATPVVKRAGASQAVVAPTSVANATAAAVDLPTAEALANALKVTANALVVDVAAITALLNEIRAALVEKGLIKGSA